MNRDDFGDLSYVPSGRHEAQVADITLDDTSRASDVVAPFDIGIDVPEDFHDLGMDWYGGFESCAGESDDGENDAAGVDDSIEMGRALPGGQNSIHSQFHWNANDDDIDLFSNQGHVSTHIGFGGQQETTEQISSKQYNVPTIL